MSAHITAINAIDQYRDPSLDGLLESRAAANRKTAAQSQRSSFRSYDEYSAAYPPLSSDVPPGPAVGYPDSAGSGGVQRSFSQRARERPYADEAFRNDDSGDDGPNLTSIYATTTQEPDGRATEPTRDSMLRGPDSRTRGQIIQDNIRSAAELAQSPRDSRPANPISVSATTRPSTLRDAANQTDEETRDWAPDRSPLQKLEVTLNDISKEEKRARVREAEMLLRDKTRTRVPAGKTTDSTVPTGHRQFESLPRAIEDVGIVRNLSNTHKDRLQHSTTIDSHRPDPRRLSGDRSGFDYQTIAAPPARSVTITRTRMAADVTAGRNGPVMDRTVSNPPPDTRGDDMRLKASARSTSGPYPRPATISSESARIPAYSRSDYPAIRDDDRTLTAQERNASHKAALEQLTGPTSTRVSSKPTARGTEVAGRIGQNETVPVPAPPATIASKDTFSFSNPLTAHHTETGTKVAGRRPNKRNSNVAFKDPYERRRPVDEWQAAEIARLHAADFRLEPIAASSAAASEHDQAWWEADARSRRRSDRPRVAATTSDYTIDDATAQFSPRLFLKCGPLLRYTGMKRTLGDNAQDFWRGTVMIVTQDSQSNLEQPPTLRVFSQPRPLLARPPATVGDGELHPQHVDPVGGAVKLSRIGRSLYVRPVEHLPEGRDLSQIETDDGLFEAVLSTNNMDVQALKVAGNSQATGERVGKHREIKGVRLYADPDRDVTFWLFKLEIELTETQQRVGYRINNGASQGFWVPAKGETMNIALHSCNGFSQTVNPDDFCGPDPLWRDILNAHQSRPFHVMLGAGDQIYNDKAMRHTQHFGEWVRNKNPHYKHNAVMTMEMREELETFYLENYSRWFSQGLFSLANAQIPMVNMWDDHDIMDGFGSYPHAFMLSPVFSGVGNIAWKYYMLFQHQSVDAMSHVDEPSWILGHKPGPYINKLSRSIYVDLGRNAALLALDCRTERMKNQVLSVDTMDIALERCRREILEDHTKHLMVLVGVPVAYPRMNWLENVLTSRAAEPVKAAGRYGLLKGSFLNKFDGGVEILDDLNDHWTASQHKEERYEFVQELQDLAAEKSVRITILSGDTHLAAVGQFYSNPKLKIPKDKDHRYMPNVVSSAIVNTPPPETLVDMINKRNKVHHLDQYTNEAMIPMFTHDTNLKKRNNKHLLPRRNWCSITEYSPGHNSLSSRTTSPSQHSQIDEQEAGSPQQKRRFSLSRNDVNPRMLLRRLSSRGAPPTAFRNDDTDADDRRGKTRGSSLDTPRRSMSHTRSLTDRIPFLRSPSPPREGSNPIDEDQSVSRNEHPVGSQDARPGVQRRPTNRSEKAARKGNMPGIDAEGNEVEINNHVDLDGGLDIILNCEVNQHDPSGITEPYRLLVPALWYDGSSDREKLYEVEQLKRPGLLARISSGRRPGHSAARSQGAGNWGQDMSDSGSESIASDEQGQQPKKKFGLFGSLRGKRQQGHDGDGNGNIGSSRPDGGNRGLAGDYNMTQQFPNGVARAGFNTAPSYHRPPEQVPLSYQSEDVDVRTSPPRRSSSFKAGNLLRKPQRKSLHRDEGAVPDAQTYAQTYTSMPQAQTRAQPLSQELDSVAAGNSYSKDVSARPVSNTGPSRAAERAQSYQVPINTTLNFPKPGRTSSYTISSNNVSRAPSYTSQEQSRISNVQQGTRAPSSYAMATTGDVPSRTPSYRANDDKILPTQHHSKHEPQRPVVGIATDHDAFSGRPQQTSLRGDGIIGRNTQTSGQEQDSRTGFSRGYSGIEAYNADRDRDLAHPNGDRPKPKRGLSLRDRARNLIDRVEGRQSSSTAYEHDANNAKFTTTTAAKDNDDYESNSNSEGWENESDIERGGKRMPKLLPRWKSKSNSKSNTGRDRDRNQERERGGDQYAAKRQYTANEPIDRDRHDDDGSVEEYSHSSRSGSYDDHDSDTEKTGLKGRLRMGLERMRSGRGNRRGSTAAA